MEGCLNSATLPMSRYFIWDPYLRYSTKVTPKWCIYWFCVIFSNSVETIYLLSQLIFLTKASSLDKFVQCLGTIAIVVNLNVTNFLVIYKQKSWADLVQEIENVASEIYRLGAPVQRKCLKALSKRYQTLGTTIQYLTIFMGFFYLCTPVLFHYITNPNASFPLVTLVYVHFELNTFWKTFCVFFTIIFGIVHNILFYSSFTNFINSLLLHVNLCFVGFCKNLKTATLPEDEQSSHHGLIQHIKIHQKLNRLCNTLESVTNNIMLFQVLSIMVSSSCLALFIFVDYQANSRFVLQPIHDLLHLLMLCWSGNQIMVQSDRVTGSAYSMTWINAKASTKKLILVLMTRSTRRTRLTAGKFCGLTLETFFRVLQTSMSYLTVLRKLHTSNK